MKSVTNLSNKELEKELKYYRQEYFLDPNGSNVEKFVENANKTLSALLKSYTGIGYDTKISLQKKSGKWEARIRGPGTKEQIIKQVKRNGKSIPKNGHSMNNTVAKLTDLLSNEIYFNEKFIGQMHPHDNIPSFIGGIAGKFLNGNTIAEEVSRVTTYLETQSVNWLSEKFGYNPNTTWAQTVHQKDILNKKDLNKIVSSGNITVGGTTANLAALLVARNKAFNKEGMSAAEKGMKNQEQGVVIGSEYAHYSLEKLCGYIGLGSENFKKAKTRGIKTFAKDDDKGSLKDLMWSSAKDGKKVVAVVGIAGTTETGNIDDLKGIYGLIKNFEKEFGYRPHFHVDAAHGGGFVLHKTYSPKTRGKVKGKFDGIQNADSITIDPHKMLYTQYSAGMILFKDKKDHNNLKQTASYLFKNNGCIDLGQKRVEGSIGLEGALQTWTSLYAIGERGYQVIQENTLRLTQYLKKQLQKDKSFQIMHEPEMNLLCFRYNNKDLSDELNDEINKKAQEKMFDNAKAYISNDKLLYRKDLKDVGKKVDVFRAVVMHPYTTKKDIDLALNEVRKGIEQVKDDLVSKMTTYRSGNASRTKAA